MVSSTTPDASVVVVTRDRPQLLRRCLDAIAAQDHAGVVETIVVFDRSEPDLDLVSDDRLRPVVVKANERTPGLPGGRNTGALAARAPVLGFCDDDDEWMPQKLTRQMEVLRDEPEVDVVVCGLTVIFRGREVRRPAPAVIRFDDLLRKRVMEANFVTALVRRDAFWDRIGPADETLPGGYAEDWEWMLRAAKQHDVRAITEPLVRISWHGSSFFSDRWGVIDEALAHLVELHPELDRPGAGRARILGQRAFAQAGAGRPAEARRTALRVLRERPLEPRGYLALLVSSGLVSADRVRLALHSFGRSV